MGEFQGSAWIIGAGGAIGRAVALLLLEKGCTRFALVDHNSFELEKTQQQMNEKKLNAPTKIILVNADVSIEDDVERMEKQVVEQLGTLHYCVNCFGVMTSPSSSLDTDPKVFREVLRVNQKGVWLCMRSQLRQILKQERYPYQDSSDRASIVNVSSNYGFGAESGMAALAAASHGIIGMTKSTALDHIDTGIRLNCVCPIASELEFPGMESPRSALEKSILTKDSKSAQDIANVIVFLLGPMASAVNGVVLPIDRGWSLYHS